MGKQFSLQVIDEISTEVGLHERVWLLVGLQLKQLQEGANCVKYSDSVKGCLNSGDRVNFYAGELFWNKC